MTLDLRGLWRGPDGEEKLCEVVRVPMTEFTRAGGTLAQLTDIIASLATLAPALHAQAAAADTADEDVTLDELAAVAAAAAPAVAAQASSRAAPAPAPTPVPTAGAAVAPRGARGAARGHDDRGAARGARRGAARGARDGAAAPAAAQGEGTSPVRVAVDGTAGGADAPGSSSAGSKRKRPAGKQPPPQRARRSAPHPVMAGINAESDDDDSPGLQGALRRSAAERERQEREQAAESD